MRSLRHTKIGEIHVFCGGRVFLGPDWKMLVGVAAVILLALVQFLAQSQASTGGRVVTALLAALTLALLGGTATRNPGTAPKAPPPPGGVGAAMREAHESLWVNIPYVGAGGARETARVELKWCYSCGRHRPPRGAHCRYCDVCVSRRDHHCPWVGVCVGAGNYHWYFALVWVALAMLLSALVNTVLSIVVRYRAARPGAGDGGAALREALGATYGLEAAVLLLTALWLVMVATLAVYHTYLVLHNITSSDAHRGRDAQIFSRGSWLRNARAALCGDTSAFGAETELLAVEADDVPTSPERAAEVKSGEVLKPLP